jgi:hypothetical protein
VRQHVAVDAVDQEERGAHTIEDGQGGEHCRIVGASGLNRHDIKGRHSHRRPCIAEIRTLRQDADFPESWRVCGAHERLSCSRWKAGHLKYIESSRAAVENQLPSNNPAARLVFYGSALFQGQQLKSQFHMDLFRAIPQKASYA